MGGVLMFRSERMRRTGARSTASGTSSHMQSWADCITGTHVSSFWKRQGLDHNETRSWHGWHRHASLVMRAFAMMAVIRHRANPPPPKKKKRRTTAKTKA